MDERVYSRPLTLEGGCADAARCLTHRHREEAFAALPSNGAQVSHLPEERAELLDDRALQVDRVPPRSHLQLDHPSEFQERLQVVPDVRGFQGHDLPDLVPREPVFRSAEQEPEDAEPARASQSPLQRMRQLVISAHGGHFAAAR